MSSATREMSRKAPATSASPGKRRRAVLSFEGRQGGGPSPQEAQECLAFLIRSAAAAELRRYHHQPYWEKEGVASDRALEVEDGLRLESVADHSWKVADAAMLLCDHYPCLDRGRCLELAIIHDKLEIIMGDWSPIDETGDGRSTHAFNPAIADKKRAAELDALEKLMSLVSAKSRKRQEALFHEMIDCKSQESRFVAAVDKLASVMFVLEKKPSLQPPHLEFTFRYGAKSVQLFPEIEPFYRALCEIMRKKYQPDPTALQAVSAIQH